MKLNLNIVDAYWKPLMHFMINIFLFCFKDVGMYCSYISVMK